MELGLDFDDCDFKEEEKQQNEQTMVYSAKMCQQNWYEDADTTDVDTAANVFKFRGDNLYHEGRFEEATKHYIDAIDSLPTQSRSLRHDFEESLARCYMYMEKYVEALDIANKLCSSATNVDQQMQGLILLNNIQSKMSNIKGEEESIKRLIELHPFHVRFWLKLASIYRDHKTEHRCNVDVSDYVKLLTCLIRARLLLKCTKKAVGSFVKNKYQQLQQNVEQDIKELNPSEEMIQKATMFLGEDIFKLDQMKDGESEETSEITRDLSDFDSYWFTWVQNPDMT